MGLHAEKILDADTGEFRETALALPSDIGRICAARDAALAKMTEAADALDAAYKISLEASEIASMAHTSGGHYAGDRSNNKHYEHLFRGKFDKAASIEVYREHLDARVWTSLIDSTGIRDLMDAQAKSEFEASLSDDVPIVSEDNVHATIETLLGDAGLIFMRGLANAFSDLDRRFKTHDGFKIGSRIILTRVFSEHGWLSHGRIQDTLIDVERVFAVLDGNAPSPRSLLSAIQASRGSGYGPRQSECEGSYFRIRGFKNGNAHLWFMQDELVEKANKVLGKYYGEVLPDGMPKDAASEDLRNPSSQVAKNLQFYPTPPAVVKKILNQCYIAEGDKVLEPSAGEGALTFAIAEKGVSVDAIEVHPERCQTIERAMVKGVRVQCRNFLQMRANPNYDWVIMNPPFYGTHWMDHVLHAFEFLKDGGSLMAILPISAEIGETARHVAFRKWASKYCSSWRGVHFNDLPAESFASSGTRINTCWVHLRK